MSANRTGQRFGTVEQGKIPVRKLMKMKDNASGVAERVDPLRGQSARPHESFVRRAYNLARHRRKSESVGCMRRAVAEGSTKARPCPFFAVAVIYGSTGRTFANGCEVEPTREQQPRGR